MDSTASAPLLGRDEELGLIAAALDRVESGEAAFLEIVGEPGIGKTRLLGELRRLAEERRFLVLSGRASQFELESPLDPFVDALDDYLATLNPRRFEPLGPERVAELATAFPALAAEVEGGLPVPPSEERYRIHRSVRSLLGLIGALRPLVIVLDDAHWSDPASLELLRHLIRRPPDGPVGVVMAYRTGTMPESWQTLADAAVREGDLDRLDVGPLGEADAHLLLAESLKDPELRGRVFEAAGGNPFFMRQVANAPHALAASGAESRDRQGVPQAVLAAIGEELAALDGPTREALEAGAIAGDPFDPGLAAAAAGMAETDLLPHLDELTRRGLVHAGDAPREFQFRHPLVWQGVYEGAAAGWRLSAHGRLDLELAAQGASAVTRAPHVEAAATPGDRDAVGILREAADASAAQAPASAAHWYRAALRLLPEGVEAAEERVSLLVPMAKALGSIGEIKKARGTLREVLELIPPEARTERVEAVVGCATMENLLRNPPEATRMLTDELEALDDPESEEAASVLLALTTLNIFESGQEDARDWGRRALELAQRRGLRGLEAAASGALSYNEGRLGNIDEATALLDPGAKLADSMPKQLAAADIGSVFWISVAEMQLERFEDAVRHAARARALARATGQGRWLPQIAAGPAWSFWGLGRVDDAIAAAEEGLEMARLTGNRQFEALILVACPFVYVPAGRFREAIAAGQEAIALTGPVAEGDHLARYARQTAAIAAFESGDAAAARRLLLEIADDDGRPQTELLWHPPALAVLTGAELLLGDVGAADRYARMNLELTESLGLAWRRSLAVRGLAAVQLARGEASEAARTSAEAAELAAQAGARVEEGRALAFAGHALAAAGDQPAGVEELERARRILDECGAVHFRDQAVRDLRKLGVRVPRRGVRGSAESGPEALSEREREIAELVADGHTNKEIAAHLFISEKTVEKHLSRVFEKLGVKARAAVGSRLLQPMAPRNRA